MHAYKKNVPAELHSTRKLNVYETSQEQNQLTKLQMLPAEPFTFMGNISDIIIHGIAPTPNEYDALKTNMPESTKVGVASVHQLRLCSRKL